jgi:hypothetical protein
MCPPFRYLNLTLHPKPHNLQHPSELWKHTAFENQLEYDEFIAQPSLLGKPSASHPDGGMKQKLHDFADKIWNKFKVVRRDIASQTSVIWARLLPGNHLPSGVLMQEIVTKLRAEMFAKWQFEPTSKGSKQTYSAISMEGAYEKWCPTWFPTWRSMGPAAGARCSQIFMSECCGYHVTDVESKVLPSAFQSHFDNQASNVSGVSRQQAAAHRKLEETKLKEERSQSSSLKEESKRAVQDSQEKARCLFLELEMIKDKRQQRADEIDRLKYMISRATDSSQKTSFEIELDSIYATPISSTPSSGSSSFSESRFSSPHHDQQAFSPIQPKCLAAVVAVDQSSVVEFKSPPPTLKVQCNATSLIPTFFDELQVTQTDTRIASAQAEAVKTYSDALFAVEQVQLITSDSSFALTYHQEKKAHEQKYRQLIEERFVIASVPGNCLFACFAYAFTKDGFMHSDTDEFDSTALRKIVSEEISRFSLDRRSPGILDGSFVGTDKELEFIVQHFCLSVRIFDHSDSLSSETASGDLKFSECVSTYLPYVEEGLSNDRMEIVLFRENSCQYSVLYERAPLDGSDSSSFDDDDKVSDDGDASDDIGCDDDDTDDEFACSTGLKAPKCTMSEIGEHDRPNSACSIVPRVHPLSSRPHHPSQSVILFTLAAAGAFHNHRSAQRQINIRVFLGDHGGLLQAICESLKLLHCVCNSNTRRMCPKRSTSRSFFFSP